MKSKNQDQQAFQLLEFHADSSWQLQYEVVCHDWRLGTASCVFHTRCSHPSETFKVDAYRISDREVELFPARKSPESVQPRIVASILSGKKGLTAPFVPHLGYLSM